VRAILASLRHDAGGTLAFVATVAAAYISLFGDFDANLPAPRLLLLVALGVVFLFAGLFAYEHCLRLGTQRAAWAYLLGQVALASLILYLSQARGFMTLLFFPLVSHAWYLFPRRQALLACALIVLGFVVAISLLSSLAVALPNSLVILAGVVFVAVFTDATLRERAARTEVERLAAELGAANQKLRAYAEQVEELATTRERNRLAREIHDSLGHYLTVINVQLEAARLLLDGAPLGQAAASPEAARAVAALTKAQSLAQEGLADVRRSVAALRAGPIGSQPLPQALTALADEACAAGIVTRFHLNGQPRPLTAQAELTLYRAAQEALTNVRKHARASRAELTLDFATPGQVRLSVNDNGVGSGAPSGGFGLLGLRERVQLLGGRVETRTAPGAGFTLEVEVPG
jgi:signal transduction histidine kinase